jgi:hypothetical protein
LYNRLSNRALDSITLFKKRYSKKPNLAHLRISSYRAFIYIPKKKRSNKKLDRKGQECRFVEYTALKSMFWVYINNTIRIERDIIFDEGPSIKSASIDTLSKNNNSNDLEDLVLDGESINYSSFFKEE